MDLFITAKIFHVLAVIAWMAGLLYLPRLFVYHVGAEKSVAKTLAVMEERLLKFIMNPAMLVALVSGFYLMTAGGFASDGWLHWKLLLVVMMLVVHMLLGKYRKELLAGRSKKSAKFFRLLNEVPTILLVGIVILVIAKPF